MNMQGVFQFEVESGFSFGILVEGLNLTIS